MEILELNDIERSADLRKRIVEAIETGKIFVYPTDTIYGIGCNAMDSDVVQKIRDLKGTQHPFSVIVPSKGWITENLEVKHPGFLRRLPGPYTLIFLKKNPNYLSSVSSSESLGIRIPNHFFTKLVTEACVPFVTTSVNRAGKPSAAKIEIIPDEIMDSVDIVVDAGTLNNPPSKVIDLTSDEPKVLRE